jgi:hypothetical protein
MQTEDKLVTEVTEGCPPPSFFLRCRYPIPAVVASPLRGYIFRSSSIAAVASYVPRAYNNIYVGLLV